MNSCRLTIILVLSLYTLSSLSQDTAIMHNVTIRDTTCTLGELLKIIQTRTSVSFSYNAGLFNEKKTVTVRADDEPVSDVLKRALDDPSLDIKMVGRHLVIYRPVITLSANPDNPFDSVYFFEIRGQVFDKLSKLPLQFANIYLADKSIGTIANEDGKFLLKLSSENLEDTLKISHMGYKQFTIPVSGQVNTDMKYFLDMDIISIQEVIIRLQSPLNILQSAMTVIPDNYPLEPALLTAFYREAVKKGNRYMIVSEAIIEMYKRGYNDLLQEDQVKIIKGRKRQDIDPSDTVVLKLKAGLNTMLLLDVIRYTPDFMTETGYYEYIMADIVVNNDHEYYAIEFTPKERAYDAFYSGRIYIDVRDLSIAGVEFSIEPSRLEEATNLFVLRKPSNYKVKLLGADYYTAYRKIGSRYYLHNIHCETSFRVRLNNQLFGSVYTTSIEMVMTKMDTTGVDRFRYREIARTTDIFNEQLSGYDEAFWGEYNFIRPEDPLVRAIENLKNAKLDLLSE
ncbi:MAG: carboxypeptidase-like regulatory domain-containing protein [Bacteroidales bacterium]|nr:carboxypeptidase-like regulatory domain-containing protein [Bacteroidales bacterium]